jgi:hypothetical protein
VTQYPIIVPNPLKSANSIAFTQYEVAPVGPEEYEGVKILHDDDECEAVGVLCWGVYGRTPNGMAIHIRDLESREWCESFLRRLGVIRE